MFIGFGPILPFRAVKHDTRLAASVLPAVKPDGEGRGLDFPNSVLRSA